MSIPRQFAEIERPEKIHFKYLNEKNMLPAICFVFSRKNVEICAKEIGISLFDSESTIPATIAKECQQILMKLPNYKEYLNLPEYVFMTSLLKKGIAIHSYTLLVENPKHRNALIEQHSETQSLLLQ